MTTIAAGLIAEVRKLADQYPDAVYRMIRHLPDEEGDTKDSQCMYDLGVVQDGPPDEGCIFGQAARRLELRKGFEYLFDGFAGRENAIITTLKENGWHLGMTAEEKDWMESVQMDQDSGKTWAEAVYG